VDVLRANNIAVLAGVRVDGTSTSGAQFDNIDTGEAIFVYSLQRWNGTRHGQRRQWRGRGG
jgi:hypothetical protein